MHLISAFSVTENSETEWLHNSIANIFYVVLEYSVVIPLHTLSLLKTKLLIKVDALVKTQVGIPIIGKRVTLSPIP